MYVKLTQFLTGIPVLLNDNFSILGGLEGVIVVWQLDTGKRRYKPRLGSPLLFFVDSPDSSISCVSILLVSLNYPLLCFTRTQYLLLIYEVFGNCIPECHMSLVLN